MGGYCGIQDVNEYCRELCLSLPVEGDDSIVCSGDVCIDVDCYWKCVEFVDEKLRRS